MPETFFRKYLNYRDTSQAWIGAYASVAPRACWFHLQIQHALLIIPSTCYFLERHPTLPFFLLCLCAPAVCSLMIEEPLSISFYTSIERKYEEKSYPPCEINMKKKVTNLGKKKWKKKLTPSRKKIEEKSYPPREKNMKKKVTPLGKKIWRKKLPPFRKFCEEKSYPHRIFF